MDKNLKVALLILLIVVFAGAAFSVFSSSNKANEILPIEGSGSNAPRESVYAKDLEVPWDIVFLPDGSALFTERNGRVRYIDSRGDLRSETILTLDTKDLGEGGLLGIEKHPSYKSNNFIYIYYTYRDGQNILNKVERYKFNQNNLNLSDKKVIVERIPGNLIHNGGRIRFGPDEKLYVTTGDSREPSTSQDRNSLAGKILRLNDDGSIPEDNPSSNSPLYALGLRNPQGLAWDPRNGQLYATDHGATNKDELNKIVRDGNYGWPEVSGKGGREGFIDPILESGSETWAPSGLAFYTGKNREFSNNLFFGSLRGTHLHRMVLSQEEGVLSDEKMFEDQFGRIRAVVFEDNALYITTSNRDGRGLPKPDDDKIIKIEF